MTCFPPEVDSVPLARRQKLSVKGLHRDLAFNATVTGRLHEVMNERLTIGPYETV